MSRPWVVPAAMLVIASLIRFPHYDVAWFGLDQIYFLYDARRVLAGHLNVVGPLASGLNIIGPLYTYLLAGLLWIRDDPAFLVLFGVACEVVAATLVYDIGRRLSGPVAGAVAAVSYMTAPVLVISTRLIWNPSLLPALVVLGWWLIVRYIERGTAVRLAAVAFVAGLCLTLHATGAFHIFGFGVAVFLTRRPSVNQLVVGGLVGALPLAPVLVRLGEGTGDLSALGARMAAPVEPLAIAKGIAQIVLALPKAFGHHWSTELSTLVLHVQAALAAIGLSVAVFRGKPFRAAWIGMAAAVLTNVASAFFYTGTIFWHYFIALLPIACLCVGSAIASLPRWRVAGAVTATVLTASHLLFTNDFDRRAMASGLIEVDGGRVGIRMPSGVGYTPTLRHLQGVGDALRDVVPDGATAMLQARGARGELWRETGAEFMPRAEGAQHDWPTGFLLMGPSAKAMHSRARVIDDRICTFERSAELSWKVLHMAPVAGWASPEFDDATWYPLNVPRRMPVPSLPGPFPPLATWRAPLTLLRGRFTPERLDDRHLVSLVIHGAPISRYRVTGVFVNGQPVGIAREREFTTTMSLTQEWLLDLTGKVREGENLIAWSFDGQLPSFDLDVFQVPCVDGEWYY